MIRILPSGGKPAPVTPPTTPAPTVQQTIQAPNPQKDVTIVLPAKVEPTFVAVCFRCGNPLELQQVSLRIDGQFIDFEERAPGNITLFMCKECGDVAKTTFKEGVEGAIKRKEDADSV